jgi:hypothetical protein
MAQPRLSECRAPNALIIGAMKSSTTTLFNTLSFHPKIFVPKIKEPNFFASTELQGIKDWASYLKLFENAKTSQRVLLEASTEYTRWPHSPNAAEKIRRILGHPKLIYVMRDPVERTISHYFHSYFRGFYKENTTLADAIRNDPVLIDTSRYHSQLCLYDNEFGRGAVLLLTADQLQDDFFDALLKVTDFLEIEPFDNSNVTNSIKNARDDLKSSGRVSKILRNHPLLKILTMRLPVQLKAVIKSIIPDMAPPPEPTQKDREQILEKLEPDLRLLYARVGALIDKWPSIKALQDR